ncbi:MATE family efflux transporter [Bacillus sp. AGMB 02131]|uniref:Probable multidrug resistance protein NorM n=1 Tax=Peribacillus faecalis TaxID=2772559 RepID=A0A927CUK6_9BACI|nr:MATE family efflux transporter [Peribacillus faecalis]MBD3107761.1 MATE family efflux transporter [Peribacillus faecalis]
MKKIDLTTGREITVISSLALPLVGTSLLQFLYSFIDMLFVGGLGSGAIAAVGSASFFVNLGYSIQAMIVVGGGIKLAHAMGSRNEKLQSAYIGSSLLLNTIIGLITIFVLFAFGNHILGFLDLNNAEVQRQAYEYLSVSGIMLFFSYYNLFFIRMFSSFGNNKQSFYISALGIFLNIVLDPLFIYYFKFGVMGAAIASLIAQITMFCLFVYISRKLLFNKKLAPVSYKHCLDILRLGLPMTTQRVLFTVINILLAKMIASYGTEAIAAQKIGLQIESVTFIVMGALNGAVGSFIGQNFGAGHIKRIKNGYSVSMMMAIGYALLISIIFILFSEQLPRLFIDDQKTIEITASYLIIIGISQIFMAMEMISNGVFSGMGLPKIPSIISIIFTAIRIPLAYALIPVLGLDGIWWSIAISSMIKGIVAIIIFQIIFRRRYNHEQ